MLLENFHPQSKLVTRTTVVDKPKFPVIDAHNHLAEPFGGGWDKKPLNELLDVLDAAGVTHLRGLGWRLGRRTALPASEGLQREGT